MIRTSSLSEACHELFARYPLAVLTDDGDETTCAMLLALPDSSGGKYFVLSQDRSKGRFSYSLRPRRTTDVVDIEPDGGAMIPDVAVKAVTHGVPIPRMDPFWMAVRRRRRTALVPVYTTSTPASPDPFWAVMPRTCVPEEQWPPFTNQCLLGHWFWEAYRTGRISFLDDLIAGTEDTVLGGYQAIPGHTVASSHAISRVLKDISCDEESTCTIARCKLAIGCHRWKRFLPRPTRLIWPLGSAGPRVLVISSASLAELRQRRHCRLSIAMQNRLQKRRI